MDMEFDFLLTGTTGFCALLERETLLHDVMPSIEELVSDQSQHVRAALGTQISGLAPILGKDETISHLLPMFLQMLKDEFPDVRLHIISKLELVNKGWWTNKLPSALLNHDQLSASSYSRNLFSQPSFNLPRTNSGACVSPSSSTSLFSPVNLASISSMRSSVISV